MFRDGGSLGRSMGAAGGGFAGLAQLCSCSASLQFGIGVRNPLCTEDEDTLNNTVSHQ